MKSALVVLGLLWTASGMAATLTGMVTQVKDGDTLTVMVDGRPLTVSIAGVDAPELRQPFGAQSRDSLTALCLQRPAVIHSPRGSESPRRGEGIKGSVACADEDVASHQVRVGMAWVTGRGDRRAPLYLLEDEAQRAHVGLWVDKQPVPPWTWRRMRHR